MDVSAADFLEYILENRTDLTCIGEGSKLEIFEAKQAQNQFFFWEGRGELVKEEGKKHCIESGEYTLNLE